MPMGTWSVYHSCCSRPHGAFLPLLHTAAAAASPCSTAKVPRCMGLPSFLFLSLLPSLCACWDEWFLFYSAFDLRHILCVCVLDTHHPTIQYLSSLFINRMISPFLRQASVHVLLSSNGLKVWNQPRTKKLSLQMSGHCLCLPSLILAFAVHFNFTSVFIPLSLVSPTYLKATFVS